MPDIGVTGPDGVVYDVPAENPEEAAKKFGQWWKLQIANPEFKKAAQSRMNKAYATEMEGAPMWAKPFMAADDIARTGLDAFSSGLIDKGLGYFTGEDEGMRTQAQRARMGTAAIPAEVLGAVMGPTTVPRLVKAIGGGPAARTATGVLGSGAEGAVVGGVDAATHDEPVVEGILSGAGMGATGQALGSVVNRVGKWWRGPDPQAPNYAQTVLPKAPTARDYANVAATETAQAVRKGEPLPQAARREFSDLNIGDPGKKFSKSQKEMLDKIVEGDPATNTYSKVGSLLSNPLIGIAAGGSTVGFGADPIMGAATGLGLMAGPRIAKSMARGGTQEAINDLRRSVYHIPKKDDPLSEEDKARFARALRQLGFSTEY